MRLKMIKEFLKITNYFEFILRFLRLFCIFDSLYHIKHQKYMNFKENFLMLTKIISFKNESIQYNYRFNL